MSGRKRTTTNRGEETHGIDNEHQSPAQASAEATQIDYADGDRDWSRPSSLDAPPARPGMTQRWKRHQLGGQPDTRNWQRALREGWKPRPADSVDGEFSSLKTDAGVISVEGLVLCEMPKKQAGQRAAHYARHTTRQMTGVESDLNRAKSPGGPPINKEHQSRTEQGRIPTVAAD